MDNFAVVLAGGRGERFWPASRKHRPKQLLRLLSERTMLEETLSRVDDLVEEENRIIVTGRQLKGLIEKEIGGLTDGNFMVEPQGRNTAPAIGIAAAKIVAEHGDGIMFVLSSDHLIRPLGTFVEALRAARGLAEAHDRLVLLGVEPSRPETGYGYIEMGEVMDQTNGFAAHDVASFKEKPNRLVAQEYYLDSKHLWNSGIFVWRAGRILEEMKAHLPELYSQLEKYKSAVGTERENEVLDEIFEKISPISIDYGVLEKTHSVAVLRAKFTWDDVGNYGALVRILEKDHEGNVTFGDDVHLFESYETTVMNDTPGAVVTYGISDLVIVREGDVLLVLHKSKVPQMRDLLEKIKDNPDLEEYL